ncbi:Complement component C1q receptor C1q/MBL/SPA receptor [Collichthys lucidus]|uniref:Complement component C1q receptor C1q/MBL/SPA receptor n=1 Tax=Collichthys lucidus TaxID=240159 RepID=A0A4U5VUV4_COLLU|nr:Complement component C1q receptor C1q/MBL/SPA receptor [Collichthys lucidus]
MGSLVSSGAALLLTSLLALLFGVSSVVGQDLRERDALCNSDGCFVVYFQRKTFLDSWKACKEKGGNLATIKRKEDAASIANLFSTLDLRHSRTDVQVWIGLQRQPRQCTTARPLRGFFWTTGDQDTEYTNWQREESPNTCMGPRCVVMGYNTEEQNDNFKWLDGSCSVPVDGYLCHYAYKGMCSALWSEGAGNALYTTPFNLLSTLLTHVPFGSVATVPCPANTKEEQSVLCMLKEDGSVGWSRDSPLCSDPPVSHNWCDQNNGGCEHFCRPAGVHFYCECANGYQLGDNGQSCELPDVCQGVPCEFECVPLLDGYRCACPEGYLLAQDERSCMDIDECLQSPCEQICVNTPGTFECQCRAGYELDYLGECEDIDECMNDPCEHACENTPGSHICHCHLGYSPVPEDPKRCQDTDECQIPGTCEQMCVNYEGGFECYCEEGYELMSDHYSCHKKGEGDDQSAVTPSFPWVTHQPGPVWEPDYWPPEEDQQLDWLTDPPRVLNSDVIWVTSAPQEEFDLVQTVHPPTQVAEEDEGDRDNVEADRSQSELEVLLITTYTTPPPTTSTSTTTDWYEDDDDETTTALPFLFTSTISEGAWNWWAGHTTSSQKPGNTEVSIIDHNMPTDSIYSNKGEEYPLGENSRFPEEEFREKDYVEIIHSQESAVPTQPISSQSPPSKAGEGGDILDPVKEDRGQKQSNTWLLVGLLVPICIFIVVMVALGIVYCTRCAVQPRNKNATDCYHWISGAHDKQGAPNPSAGVKTHV